jgi:molybdopterin adenylyltransferase
MGISVGIITVSDRSSLGVRQDLSGPAIRQWAEARGYTVTGETIVPDEFDTIAGAIIRMAEEGVNLIFTTGGTGFAPRDITPEATRSVIEREAPGFAELMRSRSLNITHRAVLSRAVSGLRKRSLIINLPGSPRAVTENLSFIEDAIPHAVELLKGEVTDCGRNNI